MLVGFRPRLVSQGSSPTAARQVLDTCGARRDRRRAVTCRARRTRTPPEAAVWERCVDQLWWRSRRDRPLVAGSGTGSRARVLRCFAPGHVLRSFAPKRVRSFGRKLAPPAPMCREEADAEGPGRLSFTSEPWAPIWERNSGPPSPRTAFAPDVGLLSCIPACGWCLPRSTWRAAPHLPP